MTAKTAVIGPINRDSDRELLAARALANLVEAMEGAFISSWQSTAAWSKQLSEGRAVLDSLSAAASIGESKS